MDDYVRVMADLASGAKAWVYIDAAARSAVGAGHVSAVSSRRRPASHPGPDGLAAGTAGG
ncbi:hypothetical protein LO762_27955 [Actinocorallia sp. API 0066]|uniref:hypothetical protein n=1 Tax=Actinocorallia sp. API 0066 TaxID=2896846 RepID=UPI001E55AE74|nr:hypothetical protein [Actinocorallia sp. API 0066]MCD0452986.1 hypothetical protein [Actinocorallia sp. API 0066]